jgi:hypothetical protein
VSFGQTDLDYKLYSQVLNDFIKEGIKYDEKTTQVVIINKYLPDENEVSFYGREFLDSDEQLINVSLHYDTVKIRLFKDKSVRDAIILLEKEFYDTPLLDNSKFNLRQTVKAITRDSLKIISILFFVETLIKAGESFTKTIQALMAYSSSPK